jgi:alpha-galactosidase
MSTTFSAFCSDAIIDASIQASSAAPKPVMTVSITTDAGDYVTIHFKSAQNFNAFCAKHNFRVEDYRNANKTN